MNQKKKVKMARIGLVVGSVSSIAGVSLLVADIKQGFPLFVIGMAVLGVVILFCMIDQL